MIRQFASALAGALCLGALPAAAVEDLTGSYDVKLVCAGIDSGAVGKQKVETTLDIVDLGGGQILFDMGAYPSGEGYVIAQTAKPDLGVASGMTCDFDTEDRNGFLLRVDVKTKAGSDKVALKGIVVIFEEPEAESAVCKLKATRTSTLATKLDSCQIL